MRRLIIPFSLWLLALAVALLLDRPVAQYLHDTTFAVRFKSSILPPILKAPGEFWFTAAVAVALLRFHPWRWKASALVILAACISGINGLIKWCAGRVRPFKVPDRATDLLPFHLTPFAGGFTGLFTTKNQCFPSGHAALAFATAAMLASLLPRWRIPFYLIAGFTGLERILENAHYVSDVVFAALLGAAGAKLIWLTLTRPPPRRRM